MSKPKRTIIDSMVNACIGTKNVYSYLTKEVGGSENVTSLKKDCYNYVNMKRCQRLVLEMLKAY